MLPIPSVSIPSCVRTLADLYWLGKKEERVLKCAVSAAGRTGRPRQPAGNSKDCGESITAPGLGCEKARMPQAAVNSWGVGPHVAWVIWVAAFLPVLKQPVPLQKPCSQRVSSWEKTGRVGRMRGGVKHPGWDTPALQSWTLSGHPEGQRET